MIGAGSAGSVMANRLTEVSGWNVLVLEAGADETLISDVPALVGNLQLTKIDWQYRTIPQTETGACLGFKEKRY